MRPLVFLLIAFLAPPAPAETAEAERIDVKVEIDGEVVRVDAAFSVAATRAEAWDVLTDFDHLADFIGNLKSSRIVARNAHPDPLRGHPERLGPAAHRPPLHRKRNARTAR